MRTFIFLLASLLAMPAIADDTYVVLGLVRTYTPPNTKTVWHRWDENGVSYPYRDNLWGTGLQIGVGHWIYPWFAVEGNYGRIGYQWIKSQWNKGDEDVAYDFENNRCLQNCDDLTGGILEAKVDAFTISTLFRPKWRIAPYLRVGYGWATVDAFYKDAETGVISRPRRHHIVASCPSVHTKDGTPNRGRKNCVEIGVKVLGVGVMGKRWAFEITEYDQPLLTWYTAPSYTYTFQYRLPF